MRADNPGAGGAVVLTGATDGVGRALARRLAADGADLILHGRSAEKGRELLTELRAAGAGKLAYELADYASLAEIDELADRLLGYDRISVLVNNAGMGVELERRESRDGHELTFQVDYLSTYVLSCRLAAKLAADGPARIVNVSSAGQAPIDFDDVMLRRYWDGGQAYCQAKLAQIMLTIDLAEALRGTGVSVNALHPASYMPTKIVTHLFVPRSELSEGVENVRRLVQDPLPPGQSGLYLNRTAVAEPQAQALDPRARARLRELSARLTGVAFPDLDGSRGEHRAGQGS